MEITFLFVVLSKTEGIFYKTKTKYFWYEKLVIFLWYIVYMRHILSNNQIILLF